MSAVSIEAGFPESDRHRIVELLRAYEAGLGVSLCFQDFAAEVAGLPGDYLPPDGGFYVARRDGVVSGLVAFRAFDRAAGIAEMKRLYIGPELRGLGIGRCLAERVLRDAEAQGYRRLRLDTLPSMIAAQALYEALGFVDIAAYTENPVPGARYLEKRLA